MNQIVPPKPLRIGSLEFDIPVELAPMAGITNTAYRRLCREYGDGVFVSEMITSRALVERTPATLRLIQFHESETPRSMQLYGVDPKTIADAVRMVVAEDLADHIDLNFGCPVPKVTRKGGGGVLPWKRDRLRAILDATVRAADEFGVPVTMKTRIGIDEDHQTYLDAGRIAEETGCAAIALHARTVQEAYAGQARWEFIASLVEAVSIPVLGNGDIWEAADALEMVRLTGCAGVVIGRGCLGRPWLFRDLDAAFTGQTRPGLPTLGEVAAMMYRHGELLAAHMGERHGLTDLRKHIAWYLKGFPAGGELRRSLAMVSSLSELAGLLGQLDPHAPFPVTELGQPRGRQGSPRAKVTMPHGWLDDADGIELDLSGAELDASGG